MVVNLRYRVWMLTFKGLKSIYKQDLEKIFSFPTNKQASVFLGPANPWLIEMSKGVTECIDIPQRLSTEVGRGPLGTSLSCLSCMYLIQTHCGVKVQENSNLRLKMQLCWDKTKAES